MRIKLAFTLILMTTFLYGQELKNNTTHHSVDHRIQIGINISPTFGYRILTGYGNSSGSPGSSFIIAQRNKMEIPDIGYSAGIDVVLNFSKLVGLQMGIQYSSKRYKTKYETLFFATTTPDPSIPEKSKYRYNFQYIDVPLTVNFTIGKKKVRFLGSIGLVANLFIREMQTSINEFQNNTQKNKAEDDSGFNRVNLSPIIRAGIDYKINDKLNLRVEPTFQIQAFSIIDAPIHENLFSAGINFGLYFGL